MNPKTKILLLAYLAAAATLALTGCASQGVGDTPSDPPPQIVYLGARDAKGQEYLTWENIPSFGKVPPDLQAVGDLGCMRVSLNLRAGGYHPKAREPSGKTMPTGGFYCELAVLAGNDSNPPRLVMHDGQISWDRPGAFDSVPESLVDKGNAECARVNPKARALAYHPKALDTNGNPIPGGGFLCVQ